MQSKILKSTSMLDGSIAKGLIAFAIPIFLGNLFQQLYNTADTIIVGNFLGKQALAAVSSSGNLIFMIVGLLNGIAMGAGVVIAKFYGAGDIVNMRRAIHTDILFGIVGGVFLTAIGVTLTPYILRLMGTPEDVLPNSIKYFRTYFAGISAVFIYNVSAGILQAIGDSKRPLIYLIISSLLNVGLDLLFVGYFGWGVEWAAAATVISQAISALLALLKLLTTKDDYKVVVKELRFHKDLLGQIIKYGLPSGIQNSVIGLANVFVQSNINAFGSDAMAACGSYAKIEGFAFLPITCFAMALATFTSQNLGAKQYDRVKKGTRFGIVCSITLAEVIGALIFVLSPYLIKIFSDDANVNAIAIRQMHVETFFFCMLAFSHCVAGTMRGAGKAYVPMTIMLSIWCVFRVIYITVMVRVVQDILIIFTAYPVTWTLSSIVFLIYYLKADWIHTFDKHELMHLEYKRI